ncbi:IclR family transcriptional regulator [Bradyrhizobium valentinum]|nr:IclR family transcriptional regulator [Bradyrhizobium valentinum]
MDGLVVGQRHANVCAMSEVRLIQSIERAAAILEIIAQEGGAARLQHIAAQAKLGKTTAHNLLKTLDELGYVHRRAGDARYHLGGRILNLARIAGDDGALRSRLRPALESVAKRTGEMVYLAVPSGDEVYYLDAIESAHALTAGACPIGVREPLEGSAVGLVFLAFMPGLGKRVLANRANALSPHILSEIKTVATRGFALDLENYQPGLHCVAIPWREAGEVRASIGLSGPSARLPPQALTDIAWMMMKEVERA